MTIIIIMETFMGHDCDAPTDKRVVMALGASSSKLGIHSFVKTSGFVIDQYMFNEFWQIIVESHPPHVGGVTLEWLGYSGEPNKQKEKFIAYLKRNDIAYEEIIHTDARISRYPSILKDIASKPSQFSQCKWLIMKSRDFKKAIMKLSTSRGNDIREYYLSVEELMKLYVEYDKRCEMREREEMIRVKSIEIIDLKRMMQEMAKTLNDVNKKNDQLLDDNVNQLRRLNSVISQNNDLQQDVTEIGRRLGAACVDRAPRPLNPIKRERFLFIRWTNLNYHRTIPNPTLADNHRVYRYYAIRGQTQYSVSALRTQRQKDPALEVILELDVQPNTKTLYNRVKEELEERGVRYVGNALSIANSDVDETELVERLSEINDDKYNV